MAYVVIPEKFLHKLGPQMAMDVHWIDVKLRDGRVLRELPVRGSSIITGRDGDPDGAAPLDFTAEDIVNLRRTSWLPFWFW